MARKPDRERQTHSSFAILAPRPLYFMFYTSRGKYICLA